MNLPTIFCWTRFGTEASQQVDAIIARKEQERLANGGLFLWGIGNSVGPGIRELLRRTDSPELLFSPIRSRPRDSDVRPARVLAWTCGITLDHRQWAIPASILVTSGAAADPAPFVRPHYALVCHSAEPLEFSGSGPTVGIRCLRNLVSGNAIGASQVTAVVERSLDAPEPGAEYRVAMQVRLAEPYFVRLDKPVLVPEGYRGAVREPGWAPATDPTEMLLDFSSPTKNLSH